MAKGKEITFDGLTISETYRLLMFMPEPLLTSWLPLFLLRFSDSRYLLVLFTRTLFGKNLYSFVFVKRKQYSNPSFSRFLLPVGKGFVLFQM